MAERNLYLHIVVPELHILRLLVPLLLSGIDINFRHEAEVLLLNRNIALFHAFFLHLDEKVANLRHYLLFDRFLFQLRITEHPFLDLWMSYIFPNPFTNDTFIYHVYFIDHIFMRFPNQINISVKLIHTHFQVL